MGISVNGIPVATGKPGKAGKSAYEAAIEGGFTGTEAQFQEQLANGIYKSGDIINAKGGRITSVSDGVDSTDAATIAQLTARIEALEAKLTPSITEAKTTADNAQTVALGCLPLSGGTMTGPIKNYELSDSSGYNIFSFQNQIGWKFRNTSMNPTGRAISLYGGEDKSVIIGVGGGDVNTDSGNVRIAGLANPINNHDAANKQYVDSKAGGIPSGVIAMWSGADNAIPSGWLLCNGSNGTPDLRNRFIVGAGSSYGVGATGGSETVTLDKTQLPEHFHNINFYSTAYYTNDNSGNIVPGIHNAGTLTGGLADTSGNTIWNQPHENRPPYYALCFIMKQ